MTTTDAEATPPPIHGPDQIVGRIRRHGWLLGITAAAFVVRVAYWIWVLPEWKPTADAHQYWLLGRSLAAGDGFELIYPQLASHPTAFRPPLYPLMLAPGFALFDGLWTARLLNAVIGSIVVALAAKLTADIAGKAAGVATGVLVSLYPPLLANDTVTLSEPPALALLLGALLLADRARWGWVGACCGLLLLTRPNVYLVVAIFAAWAGFRSGPRRALALVAVAVAVIAPWSVRNAVQVGTFKLTTSDGFTMAAIYAPLAQEEGDFVDPVLSPAYDDPSHRFAQFDEASWSSKLTREAIDGIRDNPRYVGTAVTRNFGEYFELTPERTRIAEFADGRHLGLRDRARPMFFIVTLAGAAGLGLRRQDPRVRAIMAITAQFVALSLLLVASPRLRAPLDLACCIGFGILASHLFERYTARQRRVPVP